MAAATTPREAAPATTTPKKRRSWWNVLRLFLIAILLLELGLRILGSGSPMLFQIDKDCGYLLQPDQDNTRYFGRNIINHYSMRSDEITLEKPAGRLRILFVGDSVAYGTTYVDQKEIFASRLAASLSPVTGQPTEILNMSVGGWAIPNETAFLKSRGTYDADWVIMVLNTSDLNQPFNGYSPLSMPSQKPWTAIGGTWQRYVQPRLSNRPVADAGSLAIAVPRMDEDVQKNLTLLTQAHQIVTAKGARFAIIYTPAHSAEWDGPDFQRAYQQLLSWCEKQQVPCLDLTPDFASMPINKVYFMGNIHLSPVGHQLVAERFIKEWPRLKSTPSPLKP